MMMMSAAVDCTHPQDNTPLEVHRNHGRCACYAYLKTNDFHCHDALSDQNGPPAASQTSQSPLGSSDRLFKNQSKHCQSVQAIVLQVDVRSMQNKAMQKK